MSTNSLEILQEHHIAPHVFNIQTVWVVRTSRHSIDQVHQALTTADERLILDVSKKFLCSCFTADSASEAFLMLSNAHEVTAHFQEIFQLALVGAFKSVLSNSPNTWCMELKWTGLHCTLEKILKTCVQNHHQVSWSQWRQNFWTGHLLSSSGTNTQPQPCPHCTTRFCSKHLEIYNKFCSLLPNAKLLDFAIRDFSDSSKIVSQASIGRMFGQIFHYDARGHASEEQCQVKKQLVATKTCHSRQSNTIFATNELLWRQDLGLLLCKEAVGMNHGSWRSVSIVTLMFSAAGNIKVQMDNCNWLRHNFAVKATRLSPHDCAPLILCKMHQIVDRQRGRTQMFVGTLLQNMRPISHWLLNVCGVGLPG